MKMHVDFSATTIENSENHFAWDTGGGLIIFLGRNVGVRGEIRYFHAFSDLDILGSKSPTRNLITEATPAAGVVFRF